jgi:hypothetical protein
VVQLSGDNLRNLGGRIDAQDSLLLSAGPRTLETEEHE